MYQPVHSGSTARVQRLVVVEDTRVLEALKNVYVKQHIKSPEDQLLVLLKSDPRMTIPVMAEHLGLSDRQIRRLIASLKAQNRLHREGSNKTGRWVVSKKSR